MKLIKPYDIFKIASPGASTCLTLYVNSPKQVDSLIAEVRKVAAADLSEEEIDKLFAPVRYLIGSKKWNSSPQATGIFVTEGFAGFMKIPFKIKNLAVVAKSFHVKPLIKWQQREKPFFLLHLGQDGATLFQGSMGELKPLEKYNYKKSRSMDFALDLVERSVHRTIQKTYQPLIISGETEMTEAYKNLCQYKILLDQAIMEVTPEPKLKELHQQCLFILEPYLEKVEDNLVRKYWSAKTRGGVSANLQEIVSLALKGQVKHLFINEAMNIWGQINYKTGTFSCTSRQMDAQDDDILDDLAELVLFHRGSVTVLPGKKMPESHTASAILRTALGNETKQGAQTESHASIEGRSFA